VRPTTDGLAREVFEETGLEVTRWGPLQYRVSVTAVDLGWVMSAEIYRAVEYSGDLDASRDPDGIVEAARFV
jgi:8-oxo-dGTP pyrophosphatase MutT (NUDIX family)